LASALRKALPRWLVVLGYEPEVATFDAADLLADVLIHADERWSTDEGYPTEPTDEMRAAAETFCAVMAREYQTRSLVEVAAFVVDLREHVGEEPPQ
jgi:hypothetical protein